MVSREKQALHAIHRLIHQGRSMAFEGKPSEQIFDYFDELDYLIGLVISWEDDTSEQFRDALEGICTKYGCSHIAAAFSR